MGFGCYLVPLAVLGLYLREGKGQSPRAFRDGGLSACPYTPCGRRSIHLHEEERVVEIFPDSDQLPTDDERWGWRKFSVSHASQLKGIGSTVSYSRPSKHGA